MAAMSILILRILLGATLSLTMVAAVPTCRFNTQPGLQYLGSGVDLTSFWTGDSTAVQGMMQDVVELTCDNNVTWKNPYNQKEYAIWDQVNRGSILPDPTSLDDATMSTVSTMSDVVKTKSWSLSGSYFGEFTASADWQRSWERLVQTKSTLFRNTAKVNAFVAMITTELVKPSKAYVAAVEKFPKAWQNVRAWEFVKGFFSHFGTHYIWKVSLGGQYRYEAVCNEQYVSTNTSESIKMNFGVAYEESAKASVGHGSSDSKVSADFTQNCQTKVACLGGGNKITQCGSGTEASWAQFVTSVQDFPGLTGANYEMNAMLFLDADSFANLDDKYNTLHNATIAYLAWTGLEQINEKFGAALAKLRGVLAQEKPKCFVKPVGYKYGYQAQIDEYHLYDPAYFTWVLESSECDVAPWQPPADMKHSTDFGSGRCQANEHAGETADNLSAPAALSRAQANAEAVIDEYSTTKKQMEEILERGESVSREVDSWIKQGSQFAADLDFLASVAFDADAVVTCAGTADTRPNYYGCSTCCWTNYVESLSGGERCGHEDEDAMSDARLASGDYQYCHPRQEYNWCRRDHGPAGRRLQQGERNPFAKSTKFLAAAAQPAKKNEPSIGHGLLGQTSVKFCHYGPKGDQRDGVLCRDRVTVPRALLDKNFQVRRSMGLRSQRAVVEEGEEVISI